MRDFTTIDRFEESFQKLPAHIREKFYEKLPLPSLGDHSSTPWRKLFTIFSNQVFSKNRASDYSGEGQKVR